MYVAVHPDDYNCADCTPQEKRYKGCTNKADGPGVQIGSEVLRNCLAKVLHPIIRQWLSIHNHYKSGFLYTSGGLEQQPCKYLDIMRLIDHYYNTEETE